MSSLSNKKEILQMITRKRVVIEQNYFAISNIIDDIIQNAEDDSTIKLAQEKQEALDTAINFAISQLEVLIRQFIDSLQSADAERHIELEKELQNTIDQLNEKTRILTENLSKANIINELPNDKPQDQNRPGILDTALERDVDNLFGNKANNELKDLRNGVLIDSLNQISPKDISTFNDVYFDEVSEYNEYKEKKKQIEQELNRYTEFQKAEGYAVNEQLLDIEKRLMDEINKLKVSNQLVSDTNDSILHKIANEQPQILENQQGQNDVINKQTFDMLDIAINDMISKIEFAKIPDYKNHDIKNLEDISQTLVKSLEANLETLSNDVKTLKEENQSYRLKIDEYLQTIQTLKNDRIEREHELNESYSAWVSSNKKLQDLELLLGQQTIDINDLDGQKNVIIDSLEKKLIAATENLNSILAQNEELINRQEELEEFIRVNDIKTDYSVNSFERDIEAKSLQDLVEEEANRIVDIKLTAMLSRYKEELQLLEEKVRENIEGLPTKNKDILTYEFERENENQIKFFEEKISKFENKIKRLEDKIEQAQITEQKTRETIDLLNESLDYNGIKDSILDSDVAKKLKSLEEMINQTVDKIDSLENNKQVVTKPRELTDYEINQLVESSDLYSGIRAELARLENQVSTLKSENIKIKKENFEMTNELDDSFQKFTYNTNKMRQVEELLNSQVEEFEKLSNEKDELIIALEEKIKTASSISSEEDQYDPTFEDDVAYQNEVISRENVELLIDKRVNELLADKALDVLNNLNQNIVYQKQEPVIKEVIVNTEPFETDFIAAEERKKQEVVSQPTYTYTPEPIVVQQQLDESEYKEEIHEEIIIKNNSDEPDFIDEYVEVEKEEELGYIPVEQTFESSGYDDNQIQKPVIKETVLMHKPNPNKSDTKEIIKQVTITKPKVIKEVVYQQANNEYNQQLNNEKNILQNQLDSLQQQYNYLLKELNEKPISSSDNNLDEKVIIKEVNVVNSKIPNELLENTERLKNFERLLIQIDNEISNLENESLNKFIDNQDIDHI